MGTEMTRWFFIVALAFGAGIARAEVGHTCVANCGGGAPPPPSGAGAAPQVPQPTMGDAIRNGIMQGLQQGLQQKFQDMLNGDKQSKEAEKQATKQDPEPKPFEDQTVTDETQRELEKEMMLGPPRELVSAADGRQPAKNGPDSVKPTRCANGAVGGNNQFTCHTLVCGGTSNQSVCCPSGYPYLNHCGCNCYRATDEIDCPSYSACQYEMRAQ